MKKNKTLGSKQTRRSLHCSTGFEGGLFLSVFTVQMRGSIMVCRDRYTVLEWSQAWEVIEAT